jgi:diadenylate cyclase
MSGVLRTLTDSVARIDAIAVLDILLLAFVIYQLWRMLEGTRGKQLTQGIFVLILVYLFSRPFPVLNYILSTAMQPAVIALVILFQPELRSALEQIGRIRPTQAAPAARVLQTLVEAMELFSANRIGALIAIEGSTGMSDVIETGTALDARLSTELLSSVFFPNSALHDGGVVVRGNRVVAAGCYFPTTSDPDAPRTLGMRHRAAIGLTEGCDAAVLVVSEETGGISLATGGSIERGLKLTELRDRLRRLYSTEGGIGFTRLLRRQRD